MCFGHIKMKFVSGEFLTAIVAAIIRPLHPQCENGVFFSTNKDKNTIRRD